MLTKNEGYQTLYNVEYVVWLVSVGNHTEWMLLRRFVESVEFISVLVDFCTLVLSEIWFLVLFRYKLYIF